MPDVEARISLVTTGADASASEIMKADTALRSVTSASSGLENQFQHRFQHIGLMLFAGDALRASGLGAETRQIIGGLNTALMAGGAAFGAAAGPAMLLVAALAAVAGIAARVVEKHKEEAESLQKLADAQEKSYRGYADEATALQHIQDVGGRLTPVMQAMLAADHAVAEDMKANLLATQEKEIAALEKQRAQLQTLQELHNVWAKSIDLAKVALNDLWQVAQRLSPELELISKGVQAMSSYLAGMLSHVTAHVQLTGDLKQKYDELSAAIARVRFQHQALAQGATTDLKAIGDAAEKEADQERQRMDNHIARWVKDQQEMTKEQTKQVDEREKKAKQAADRIGSDFAAMTNDMLFRGQSMTQAFTSMWQRMAEQVITYIEKMIAEWAVFTAMSSFGGPMGAIGAKGLASMGFATGGSVFVDQPTLMLAGEGGPEVATFTPLSGGGSPAGGGTTIQIGSVNTTVNGVQDPSQIARVVGREIIKEIRGQGQLNFLRS